jgi:aminoglycoside phosphotransferase (APT) family kinase protein
VDDLEPVGTQKNLDRVVTYLRDQHLIDGPIDSVRAERAGMGQSYENWLVEVRTPELARFIVRREPASGPLEPYDIAREAHLLTALASHGVPVPPVLALCTDRDVLARPFALFGFVEGDIPDYRNIASTASWGDLATRRAMLESLVSVLAAIQAVDWRRPEFGAAVSEPSDGSPLPARIHRMRAQLETLRPTGSMELATIADAGEWLITEGEQLPPTQLVLAHGDYRVGNLIWDGTDITSVLDWEMASVGDPMQDIGYLCHPLHREAHPDLIGMLGSRDEVFGLYEQATGRAVDVRRVHLYLIYALYFVAFTNVCLFLRTTAGATTDVRVPSNFPKTFRILHRLLDEIARYEAGESFC